MTEDQAYVYYEKIENMLFDAHLSPISHISQDFMCLEDIYRLHITFIWKLTKSGQLSVASQRAINRVEECRKKISQFPYVQYFRALGSTNSTCICIIDKYEIRFKNIT